MKADNVTLPGSGKFVISRVALIRAPRQLPALANMTQGYPLQVGVTSVATSEHLYQASKLRHGDRSLVLGAATGKLAKTEANATKEMWHPDWDDIRIPVMRWSLAVKLQQHWEQIMPLLGDTGTQDIVEWSRTDSFWGALPHEHGTLTGCNWLGALWQELRDVALAHGRQAIARQTVPPDCLCDDWAWPTVL